MKNQSDARRKLRALQKERRIEPNACEEGLGYVRRIRDCTTFAAVAAARITWIFRIFSVISTPTKLTPRAMFFITATNILRLLNKRVHKLSTVWA